ncbi:MAG TPA: protein-L-isoaspartate(D-aspartate) O-methyltransferase [Syntrophales bacterium]|nr:protein-L-isoaspartate(D-aspartate) O-methyltransferase [Syntrophales bacterium]HON99673.1 protein-L-isoaspartate(D-aspartate) O-methyltransferase [Syntrophales bacterium]HPC00656.1 protein-L-isoaspartate(D-aspartate) O-methyltransferase [Syntrophales bacterium]HRS86346.1 protein-L-isoaspartate(D-aspartate) O-methyltransferase [Syntrophales bacterium]HRV42460.1 protein-L-isoaspartate(D-aspartate) O-methyltransferase [Syntrophales bacterium]
MGKVFRFHSYLSCGLLLAAMAPLFLPGGCRGETDAEGRYRALREAMVARQIADRGVRHEGVLAAMRKVPRHLFVPPHLRPLAYGDHPLPIGEGQTISQPYIVALMTEALAPDRSMKVLEIGTGSGYQAAVLAELCREVFTIEIIPSLARKAQEILGRTYPNVRVRIGDGYRGWPEEAPFDAVIVTCSPRAVPEPLIAQLREGGRMIIPVGEAGAQELVLLKKEKGRLRRHSILPVRFVPMVDPRGGIY